MPTLPQSNATNAFAAFSSQLNLTYTSPADYVKRIDLFKESLLRVAEINKEATTYYVSRALRCHALLALPVPAYSCSTCACTQQPECCT